MRAAHGSSEVRLTVFGKLMRGLAPALPLTLRDVDGYLLKENTDPDRALMPRLYIVDVQRHSQGRQHAPVSHQAAQCSWVRASPSRLPL
jgi:hypothetical protein